MSGKVGRGTLGQKWATYSSATFTVLFLSSQSSLTQFLKFKTLRLDFISELGRHLGHWRAGSRENASFLRCLHKFGQTGLQEVRDGVYA